jgi:hypothetical protein
VYWQPWTATVYDFSANKHIVLLTNFAFFFAIFVAVFVNCTSGVDNFGLFVDGK